MRKSMYRQRTMKYFIEAAAEIISTEGIDEVNIRDVAEKAGYNSATLYNYFDNLDHLKSMASLSFIDDYTSALDEYIKDANNAYELNLKVWECFLRHAYRSPKIFISLFGTYLSENKDTHMKDYYELYPDKLEAIPIYLNPMIVQENIYDRSMVLLNKCVEEDFFSKDDLHAINELSFFVYKGMMCQLITKPTQKNYIKITEREFLTRSMDYLNRVLESYKLK